MLAALHASHDVLNEALHVRQAEPVIVYRASSLSMPPQSPTRAQIEALESHLSQHEQVTIEPVHRFARGMYVREITIPKDTLMTGKVHKHEHVSIMIRGDMTVLTEDGMQRICGYHPFISPPGTKRVGYAHEETVWLTVHLNPGDETDVERIEAALVEPWPPVQQLES